MRSWTVAPCEPRKQPIEYEREANPMRKTIVSEFVTLDGVMEDPGGAEGFKHGGWTFQFGSEEDASTGREQAVPFWRRAAHLPTSQGVARFILISFLVLHIRKGKRCQTIQFVMSKSQQSIQRPPAPSMQMCLGGRCRSIQPATLICSTRRAALEALLSRWGRRRVPGLARC